MKLFFCGQPGKGTGWGTCNTNLIRELSKLCDLELVEKQPRAKLPGPAFVPIQDFKLTPLFEVQSEFTMGYCFTECPLDDDSRRNASKYALIFAGSSWNKQRIQDAGIKTPCEVLLQGIDHSLFKPQPPSQRKGFVVFSGGKFEFRKGQDYVIAAMKQFMAVRTDAVLITAWHNHWKQSEQTMRWSWLIDHEKPLAGLPMDRVFQAPLMSQEKLPEFYGLSHVGLFPNRCEAGNNLVMAEYMACERPIIASYATGHKDILDPGFLPLLTNGDYDPAGWFNPHVSDIIAQLEWCYQNRDVLQDLGSNCSELVKSFTWEACAKQIIAAIPKLE